MSDKEYVNKCKIQERTFDNGGSILKCALSVDELMKHADENGWVNIDIHRRREVSDKGATHYATFNKWKPKTQSKGDSDKLPF